MYSKKDKSINYSRKLEDKKIDLPSSRCMVCVKDSIYLGMNYITTQI